VLRDQGKNEQAEEICRQALGLMETVLGKRRGESSRQAKSESRASSMVFHPKEPKKRPLS
jgi:hypothetical protein